MRTFSISYPGDDGYEEYAVDWNDKNGRWNMSYRERSCARWVDDGKVNESAYEVMIEKFGLPKGKLSLEQVIRMSPKKLAELGTKDPVSSNLGDHRHASEVKQNE